MKTAIILAAGRGERLRPLTDVCPKPLIRVQDIPLIEYHVKGLAQAGFETIIINHAYLGGQLKQYLHHGQAFGVNLVYSAEPPGALETGGGLYQIIQRFNLNQPFLSVNADIYTDYPFAQLQKPTQALAHLVLTKNPKQNPQGDFGLTDEGNLTLENKLYTYTGIAAYDPDLFKNCRPGRFSVMRLIRERMTSNQITGEVFTGAWQDIGSIQRLIEARTSCGSRDLTTL